jgi:hypothetical protein
MPQKIDTADCVEQMKTGNAGTEVVVQVILVVVIMLIPIPLNDEGEGECHAAATPMIPMC